MNHEKQNAILRYWFGDDPLKPLANQKVWFAKNEKIDKQIHELFEPYLAEASSGAYDSWTRTADGCLALVILCDQFPRNMYRGDEAAFAYDEIALRAAQIAVDSGFDEKMTIVERCFLYLPFEHSEKIEVQKQSVELFSQLMHEAHGEEQSFIREALDYALRHQQIIEKFGRFPHRNEILGRASTKEEAVFLRQPGSSF